MSARTTAEPASGAGVLAAYARQAGVFDEMLDPKGAVRAPWADFMAHLDGLSPEVLARRFARGDQYLRDAGVLYRQYDDTVSSEREWPLSHVPVILGEAEWQGIAAGLIERAELLEYLMGDFYGANHLVASGQIPAALLGQNPAWLRPMVGAQRHGTPYLNFLSFEIARGPEGKWWVISDIVSSPYSAGFAVENRVAMSRVFPNFYAGSNVHRIAGFFQEVQQNLFELDRKERGQIALLTPGPMNQNYAEHAYLARYLGLLLVEGEDMIVSKGRVMVRTVAGPRPVSVLWNRLSEIMTDPLELEASSLLGTPGMLEALRRGTLTSWNALGAGVLETRALMAFLPKIARARLGRGLAMPNIATWWCGHKAARAYVAQHAGRMMVGSAFSTVPLMSDPMTQPPGAGGAERLRSMGEVEARGMVGQEVVTLSTTPVFEGGALVARPVSLRMFLVRTRAGWQVMPGGYARVSAGKDPKAFAMQRGGRVADVWVTSEAPVPVTSLLRDEAHTTPRLTATSALPSRAADNLFWVGRNVERAEVNMRIFRAYFARISDGLSPDAPLLTYVRRTLMRDVAHHPVAMAQQFDGPLRGALLSATKIGDRFSPDGMKALKESVRLVEALAARGYEADDLPAEVSQLLRQITGFAGLVHENMYRSDGWRFLGLGTSLERAANMVQILRHLTAAKAPDGALDLALELGDSVVTHRARFSVLATARSVLDLLVLDPHNPRSVLYHVTRAKQQIAELPGQGSDHVMGAAARDVLRLETTLATSTPVLLTAEVLDGVTRDLWALSDALTEAYLV